MRAIWNGTISFGLVNIPISLYPATRTAETIKFRLLRGSDQSPIQNKRVAEADGQEVPWDHIVKGYEYEKNHYVILEPADFERIKLDSNQTVNIQEFVTLDKIDPMFFDEPYYLVPDKGGEKAYALLRDALKKCGKVGIAKVILKTREHLAAVRPRGNALVLELMHFPQELVNPEELKLPGTQHVGTKELGMAEALIQDMFNEWEPQKYHDEYREALIKVIEEKRKSGGKEAPAAKPQKRKAGEIVDLLSVLQESLQHIQATRKK
jgi:DNA end-binding protein Ku